MGGELYAGVTEVADQDRRAGDGDFGELGVDPGVGSGRDMECDRAGMRIDLGGQEGGFAAAVDSVAS